MFLNAPGLQAHTKASKKTESFVGPTSQAQGVREADETTQ